MKVVFQIDFDPTELVNLQDYYQTVLIKHFPNQKAIKQRDGGFALNMDTGQVNTDKFNIYDGFEFTNNDRTRRLVISPKSIVLEDIKYSRSEAFFEDLEIGCSKLLEQFKVKVLNRVGLRYINKIDIVQIDKKAEIGKYIHSNLLQQIVNPVTHEMDPIRMMSQNIFRKNNDILQFNYGVWNEDFPNLSQGNVFILDYDMYSLLPYNVNDIDLIGKSKEYRNVIRNTFNESITDELKKYMNAKTKNS